MKTTHVLYFHSRKNFRDISTWGKELMPSDATINEVRKAARISGCEGFGIMRNLGESNQELLHMEWFVSA